MTLTPEQLNDLVEQYCNRVVDEMSTDEMSTKEMERLVYDLLVDSFAYESEKDMEALICSIYDQEYYQQLVENVTAEQPAQDPD